MLQKFKNFDGKNLTTFKIGGKIGKLLIASNIKELKEAIQILSNEKKWLILGAGSNILMSDKGLDGAIKLKGDFLKITGFLFVIASLIPILPSGSFFTSYAASFFWLNYSFLLKVDSNKQEKRK